MTIVVMQNGVDYAHWMKYWQNSGRQVNYDDVSTIPTGGYD
jgi:hypothetical protein